MHYQELKKKKNNGRIGLQKNSRNYSGYNRKEYGRNRIIKEKI